VQHALARPDLQFLCYTQYIWHCV